MSQKVATLSANLDQDTLLTDIVYLKSGLSGDVTFTFNGNGSAGSIDFSGLTGLALELKPESAAAAIASVTVDSISAAGLVSGATLSAEPNAEFTCSGFAAELESLDMNFDFDIPQKKFTYNSGSGKLNLKNIEGVEGDVELDLSFGSASASASFAMDGNIEAFGFDISGESLSATFGYDFTVSKIEGKGLSVQRSDNSDFNLEDVSFELSDGEISTFSCGTSEIKYESIKFAVSSVTYDSATTELQFSANLELPSMQMEVTDFKVDSDGSVNTDSMSLSLDIDMDPLIISTGVATFSDSKFSLIGASAKFAGTGIDADVIIGASTFNYGYVSLTISGNVPIGTSGLQFTSLSGLAGYNYTADQEGNGQASLGDLQIGFKIGIGDVAGAVELIGGIGGQTMGGDVTLNINGAVKAPANAPHYFESIVNINYMVGSDTVSGDITTSVSLPPGSGSMLNMEDATMNYASDGENWSLDAPRVTGKIFSEIEYGASLTASSGLENSGFSGNVDGSLNYTVLKSIVYPDGTGATGRGPFDPIATAEGDDSSCTVWGFGFMGDLHLELLGKFDASLNETGVSGSISASIGGSADVLVKFPSALWFLTPVVKVASIDASGSVNLACSGSDVRLFGDVNFTEGDESSHAELDIIL